MKDKRNPGLPIALAYVIVGALWILLSDEILEASGFGVAALTELQTVKGWLFVGASGVLIYALVTIAFRSVGRSKAGIREFQDLLEQVADHTGVMIWAYDADGRRAQYLSANSTEIWGRPLEEMYGHPRYLLDIVHPEDRPRILEAANNAGGALESEYRITRRDGETRWLRTLSSPIRNRAGEIERVIGITEDVTDAIARERSLADSEERFRVTFEQAGVGMAHVSWNGRFLRVNDRLCEITGYSREEMLDLTFQEITHPDDVERDLEGARRLRDGEGADYSIEKRYLRKDGATVWVNLTSAAVCDSSGTPLHFMAVIEDITERKQAEQALKESEERFRAIFFAEPEGIKLFSRDGTILDMNPAGLGLFEASHRDEAIGKSVVPMVAPEYRERYLAMQDAVFEGVSGKMELEFEGRRGGRRWLETHAAPIRDAKGDVRVGLSVTRDITARKHAEAALQESETRLRLALDAAGMGTWEYDISSGLMHLDERASEAYGVDSPLTMQALSSRVAPEDQDGLRGAIAAASDPARRTPVSEQCRVVDPDGGTRWLWMMGAVEFAGEGEDVRPVRGLGTVQDVTDRRRRQEEQMLLASAIEQASDGVLITDAGGVIQYVNPAFERITGFTRDEAIGRTPNILKSGEQGELFYRRMWSRLLAGQSVEHRITNRRKDGSTYLQDIAITPVRTGGGGITHMVAGFRDVTREVELEQQVRQSQKLEGIGRLAGGIAHDFNNMLTAIKGHAEFALDGLDDADPSRRDMCEVLSAAGRAQDLTRQLLYFSRRQALDPRVVDIEDLIRSSEKMLTRLIGEDVKLEIHVAPDLWHVKADAGQLHQVLVNLAVNARDAMPEGGLLTIRASNIALEEEARRGVSERLRAGEYVCIGVSDTGSGIDATTIDKIFEPFYTTKDPGKGTGLGLSTVFGIVKQTGGCIQVDSQPGAGATFEVLLPRTREDIAHATRAPAQPDDAGGSETVLIVEDQAGVRSVARRALERAGYHILEAEHGLAALAVWSEYCEAIDLVLTDVVMPEMGGWALAERLRKECPSLPVIFMSGYASDEPAGSLERRDTFPSTEKPFDVRQLRLKVREVLDEERERA